MYFSRSCKPKTRPVGAKMVSQISNQFVIIRNHTFGICNLSITIQKQFSICGCIILKLQVLNLWLRIITNRLLNCEIILTPTFLLCGARVSDLYYVGRVTILLFCI
jgi:hypothetical protein